MDRMRMLELAGAVEAAPHADVGGSGEHVPVDVGRMLDDGLDAFTMNAVAMCAGDGHSCGTAGCIAGWALSMFSNEKKLGRLQVEIGEKRRTWWYDGVWTEIAGLLDLSVDAARVLAFPPGLPGGLRGVSPKTAASVLRLLVRMDKDRDVEVTPDDVQTAWNLCTAEEASS